MFKREFVPDPFIGWIIKQTMRVLAALFAFGLIAVVATLVFRVLAGCVDALHGVGHTVISLWTSLAHVYVETGDIGQFLLICVIGAILLMVIYHGISFLVSARGGVTA